MSDKEIITKSTYSATCGMCGKWTSIRKFEHKYCNRCRKSIKAKISNRQKRIRQLNNEMNYYKDCLDSESE